MFTTSDRENLTSDYNTRHIVPFSTFGQKVIDNLVMLVLGAIALGVAYAIVTML